METLKRKSDEKSTKSNKRKKCANETCNTRAESVGLCKLHGGGKRCTFEGCDVSARAKTEYCTSHGIRCKIENCKSGATDGILHVCKKHGAGRRCQQQNCKSAAPDSTGLCTRHGGGVRCKVKNCKSGACNITSKLCRKHKGGRRCIEQSCTRGAPPKSQYCILHGGGKRCEFKDCKTSALRGGLPYCTRHGGGRICKMKNCQKVASRTDFCRRHGGFIKCSFKDCTTSARNKKTADDPRSGYCSAHGGGIRCVGCALFCVPKTGDKCSYCNTNRVRHTKEQEVVDFLNQNVDKIGTKMTSRDTTVGGNLCLKYRPDILYDLPGHSVIVEVDEDQHSTYDKQCEQARMENITVSLDKPVIFIRYNPDVYKVNGHTSRVFTTIRLQNLLSTLMESLSQTPDKPLTVKYLYYDE